MFMNSGGDRLVSRKRKHIAMLILYTYYCFDDLSLALIFLIADFSLRAITLIPSIQNTLHPFGIGLNLLPETLVDDL